MRVKSYPIQIWFLDNDLDLSAQALTNKRLLTTIVGCYNALVSARMYYIGIRSVKFYKYYFNKEHIFETLDKFFPLWPLSHAPGFKSYDTRTTKWCRQCKEHYDYVLRYLSILFSEYSFRFHKSHHLEKFIEWETFDAPKLKIPEGHLNKITLPWKCINPKYRKKDIIEGYRLQYKSLLDNPFDDYNGTPRDIPSWIMDKYMITV